MGGGWAADGRWAGGGRAVGGRCRLLERPEGSEAEDLQGGEFEDGGAAEDDLLLLPLGRDAELLLIEEELPGEITDRQAKKTADHRQTGKQQGW